MLNLRITLIKISYPPKQPDPVCIDKCIDTCRLLHYLTVKKPCMHQVQFGGTYQNTSMSRVNGNVLLMNVEGEADQDQAFDYTERTTFKEVRDHVSKLTWYPKNRIRLYNAKREPLNLGDYVCKHASSGVIFYDTRHFVNYKYRQIDSEDDETLITFVCEVEDGDSLGDNPILFLSIPVNHRCSHFKIIDKEGEELQVYKQGRCWSDPLMMYFAVVPVELSACYNIIGAPILPKQPEPIR